MREKFFGVLQRVGRSFMLPIAILPVAGLLLGLGSSFTNETTLATYNLLGVMGPGTVPYFIFSVLSKCGGVIFDNLPLIFAIGVAIGMARQEKEVAALAAAVSFLVMHSAISAMITLTGGVENLLEGSTTSVLGITSLQMGAFGGIIAANRQVTLEMVEHINENKQFVEVLIAPEFESAALELLQQKKNLRVLRTGGIDAPAAVEVRSVDGGVLVQDVDHVSEDPATFTVPTDRKPTDAEMHELMFAWRVCKGVKSNAILVSRDHAGIGMGPGQPNRVDSALLACKRAHEACERMGVEPKGLVCASDAFFPFRDNVDTLAEWGITAIIQPGGSVRDEESIQACNEHGIAMVFTGHRHFRH